MRHCTQCGSPTPDDARFCPRCGTAVAAGSGDPMLGKVISDRYLLIEKIGQGGSGTIYRGEHTTLRKKVAVKILHAQLSTDDTALERFRREATTVAELDNDHILQVLDFGRTEDNRLFFAMEYLEGETLTKVLERDKKLPVPRAIDILTQIAEALMEAHGLGYVHRDLRPRNVYLINKRGRADFVKLLDFGLAKLILPTAEAKQTAMGMTFGDPRYMSPEQARGEPLDRRSDIYSLGAIAFEMLAGTPPYSGSGTFEILQQHLDAPVPRVRDRRPDCPEWLDAVVHRALSKQRDGRFLTVLKMLESLRAQTAPPAVDAAEKAAHAQLTAEGTKEQPQRSAPHAQTIMGQAPSVAVPPAAAASPQMAHAPTEPNATVPKSVTGPQVNALAAAVGVGNRATTNPPKANETQALTSLKSNVPAAPQTQPGAKKKGKDRSADKPPASTQPASAASGSVEVATPSSLRAPDAANVPSVVVESSSHEKTMPERPAPRVEPPKPAATPPRVDVTPPRSELTPPRVEVAPGQLTSDGKRPPTGEWFSSEVASAGAGTYDDDFDDVPRKNRGPIIIGAVIGGLGLVVVAVIALLPKPAHKPLRGEEALNQPAATSPSGASDKPSGTSDKPSASSAAAAPSGAAMAPSGAGTAAAPTGTSSAATGLAAAPTGTSAAPSGSSSGSSGTASGTSAAPTGASIAAAKPAAPSEPTGAIAAPAPKPAPAPVAQKPVPAPVVAQKPAPAPATPKTAEKPAKIEKPAAAVAAVDRPAKAEKPAKADKSDKADKAPVRVAAADKPAASTDKHKKGPDGFKDPFATEPAAAKPSGESSAQAEFFIKLGRQKLNADELSAAAANFNKAREYDARSPEAIAGLGEVAFEQGDYNGAAVHLKQALKLSPNRARYLVLLGQTYYKMGKAKEAVGEYKKALRIDPGNAEAQHSLEVAERKLSGG